MPTYPSNELHRKGTAPVSALTDFIKHDMVMTREYQPVMIRELIQHNGRCSKTHLAKAILVNDQFQVKRAERVLMR